MDEISNFRRLVCSLEIFCPPMKFRKQNGPYSALLSLAFSLKNWVKIFFFFKVSTFLALYKGAENDSQKIKIVGDFIDFFRWINDI